jgi:hypothetical protein
MRLSSSAAPTTTTPTQIARIYRTLPILSTVELLSHSTCAQATGIEKGINSRVWNVPTESPRALGGALGGAQMDVRNGPIHARFGLRRKGRPYMREASCTWPSRVCLIRSAIRWRRSGTKLV